MLKRVYFRLIFSMIILLCGFYNVPWQANAAISIEKQIKNISNKYPTGSRFDSRFLVITSITEDGKTIDVEAECGGCNALVVYVTKQIFRNPFIPYKSDYINIGTASTASPSEMRELFKRAKVGDVVWWRSGKKDHHVAIFLSSSSDGIYVYESNFGGPNKVWYNHRWLWSNMKSASYGASQVTVCRSFNYNEVSNEREKLALYVNGKRVRASASIYEGDKLQLSLRTSARKMNGKYYYKKVKTKKVIWTSSNRELLEINKSGVMTAGKYRGSVWVVAKYGGQEKVIEVNVNWNKEKKNGITRNPFGMCTVIS